MGIGSSKYELQSGLVMTITFFTGRKRPAHAATFLFHIVKSGFFYLQLERIVTVSTAVYLNSTFLAEEIRSSENKMYLRSYMPMADTHVL